ncbi:hypothetical protein ACJJTC_002102 [Scirpophaga incertulas]
MIVRPPLINSPTVPTVHKLPDSANGPRPVKGRGPGSDLEPHDEISTRHECTGPEDAVDLALHGRSLLTGDLKNEELTPQTTQDRSFWRRLTRKADLKEMGTRPSRRKR